MVIVNKTTPQASILKAMKAAVFGPNFGGCQNLYLCLEEFITREGLL